MIKDRINSDLKQAMLSGDKGLVTILRGLKSVILDQEIKEGVRDTGLEESVVIALLQKEAKKRKEASELYETSGNPDRAAAEISEYEITMKYLPQQLSEEEILVIIDDVVASIGSELTRQQMGQVIGQVKARTEGKADGALIAKLVQGKLS